MNKWASRIVTKVTGVRVERLQDISRDDAKAEGVSNVWRWHITESNPEHFKRGLLRPYVANYSVLWDSINTKSGLTWDFNPWVWVYEFPQYNASSSPTDPLSETSSAEWRKAREGDWGEHFSNSDESGEVAG